MSDIREAIRIIEGAVSEKFSKYNKIYLFATENITGYIEKITGKNILTVCGSGDQAISMLGRAKKIFTFDVNVLSKYIMFLKLYAINSLSFKEFTDFFIYDEMDYNLFKKIDIQEKDIFDFWNTLYKYFNYEGKKLYNSNLFIRNNAEFYFKNIAYLNEINYCIAKNSILETEIFFTNRNLYDLKDMKESFDLIYLSNIGDYISDVDAFIKYIDVLSNLFSCKIILAYLYDFGEKDSYFNKLNNPNYIESNIIDCKMHKFDGAYSKIDVILEKEV